LLLVSYEYSRINSYSCGEINDLSVSILFLSSSRTGSYFSIRWKVSKNLVKTNPQPGVLTALSLAPINNFFKFEDWCFNPIYSWIYEALSLFRLRRKSVKKQKEWALIKFPCLTTRGRSLEIFSEAYSVFSFLFFSGGIFCLLFFAVEKK
jgi:hypothetical protein